MRYFVETMESGGPPVNILRKSSDDEGRDGEQWLPDEDVWIPNAYLTVDQEKEPGCWHEIREDDLPSAKAASIEWERSLGSALV